MNDWNPELYMQYRSERTQPSIDLITRINFLDPESIIDIGCGPGNSTQGLVHRWPGAQVTGMDSSAAMIRQAQQDYPGQRWIVADVSNFRPDSQYDIVFSNAAIQWIPDHDRLLQKFHSMLTDKGVLAVQIPLFWQMPLGQVIDVTAKESRWQDRIGDVANLFTIHDYGFYYDHLSALFEGVEMWECRYLHIMDSHDAIVNMMRSTGLKPYLERLDNDTQKDDFEKAVLTQIMAAYPVQKNGKVLLPFDRLFFIGSR